MIYLNVDNLSQKEIESLKKHELTYIVESSGFYKIGKSEFQNLHNRMYTFNLHNPSYELVRLYNGNIEKLLHFKYKEKLLYGEWFKLTEEDLKEIDNLSINEEALEELKRSYIPKETNIFKMKKEGTYVRCPQKIKIEAKLTELLEPHLSTIAKEFNCTLEEEKG